MALSSKALWILAEMAKGKSLCFSQDGEVVWLHTPEPHHNDTLPAQYDAPIQELMGPKLIDCDPNPTHWTDANVFDITDAGRKALAGTR